MLAQLFWGHGLKRKRDIPETRFAVFVVEISDFDHDFPRSKHP